VSNVGNNSPPLNTNDDKKTKVIYDNDNDKILHKIVEILSLTNESLDGYMDNNDLSMHVLIGPIWNELCLLKTKGVKPRIMTEMTHQNISYCEKMMRILEVRHMDGIRSNFKIVDGKICLLYSIFMEKSSPASHAIISNVNEMVIHRGVYLKLCGARQYLRSKAIPAEHRMRDMGLGHVNEKTEVSFGAESSTTTIVNILNNSL
jgi:hypothetical protein